jgi:hypothetical protein
MVRGRLLFEKINPRPCLSIVAKSERQRRKYSYFHLTVYCAFEAGYSFFLSCHENFPDEVDVDSLGMYRKHLIINLQVLVSTPELVSKRHGNKPDNSASHD